MNQEERDFIKQVDELILAAPPDVLLRLGEIDKKTQLSGKTFYDVYCGLDYEERKKITIFQTKNE